MNLAAVDWIFLIWYFILSIGIGLYYSGKAGKSISEYFVSGRSLPWWLLGTSMVATTFSSDTPLAVTGIVIKDGISGNWFWWTFMFGGSLTVFFFAHLWRRAAVLTEVEFIDIRYSGASARFLRGFKALYLGIPASCIIFGWVTLAMIKIIQVVFKTSGLQALGICILITIFYTALSGLWGVVATDMLLFAIAMLGAILLSVVSVEKVGGIKALLAAIQSISQQTDKNYLSVFPSLGQALPLAFFVALFVQWWAVYYPGAEPGGGGWVAQRMLAARNPKHAVSGTLWFNIAHYVIRPWPWIITALCAMVVFPELSAGNTANVEAAYPRMLAILPKGIMGLMIASLFAAYMSTIESILNLAGSYLLNDFYKPFLNKAATEKHYVLVSRLLVVFVAILGTGFSFILGSVKMGWALIMELSGGIGLVLLLRWYWWRINAWSEISAITASGLMAVYLKIVPDSFLITSLSRRLQNLGFNVDPWAVNILLIVAFTTIVWIVATFLTPPDSREKLLSFYKKVKPGGFWAPIAALNRESYKLKVHPFLGWICGVLVILFFLLGIGEILFMRWAAGLLYLAAGTVSAIVLSKIIRKIDWEVQ
jgi:Na+/proline symporter